MKFHDFLMNWTAVPVIILVFMHFLAPSELFDFLSMVWVLIIIQFMAFFYKVTNRD